MGSCIAGLIVTKGWNALKQRCNTWSKAVNLLVERVASPRCRSQGASFDVHIAPACRKALALPWQSE